MVVVAFLCCFSLIDTIQARKQDASHWLFDDDDDDDGDLFVQESELARIPSLEERLAAETQHAEALQQVGLSGLCIIIGLEYECSSLLDRRRRKFCVDS